MGKKTKKGKQRKDIFYRRAKEAGYRARAAFKLIQLNRKYNFFQSVRVCIDLCAAPGSWMQVASKFMPVSSVIIGVDRFPIPPIPNTIGIQGDITTEKVRQELKANLKTWKADLVLHDGAPNVGQNWLHDAYQQNLLVLHSFKLACEFLQKGGSFITKVFRSKDHLSLQYVFRKLFRKVEATKPIASRFESAEIFVVCQGFLAPDKIDPEFFDAKFVFQSLEKEPKNKINIHKPETTKRKAEGYEEGATMLFKQKKISEFIQSSNFIDILEEANEFEWDLPAAEESVHTTSEIKELCKDIKVLGRRELRTLLNWRKIVKEEVDESKPIIEDIKEDKVEEKKEIDDEDEIGEDLKELEQIQEQITKLKADKEREDKQQRKKAEKKKKKVEDKLKLRLMVPGDPGPQEARMEGLFSISTLDKTENVDEILDQGADVLAESDSDTDTEMPSQTREFYSKSGAMLDSTGTFHKTAGEESELESENSDSDEEEEEGLKMEEEEKKASKKKVTFADDPSDSEDDPDDDVAKTNPLITDLVGDDPSERRERKAEKWFNKNMFGEMEEEDVEDFEIESAIKQHEESGRIVIQKTTEAEQQPEIASKIVLEAKTGTKRKFEDDFSANDAPASDSGSDAESDDDTDSDSGVDSDDKEASNKQNGEFESKRKKKRKASEGLDPVGLALATKLIRSKKAERDIYDDAWNRYMFDDENLPDWFVKDEKAHNSRRIEVDKEDLKMYKENSKSVDARTIKKVVEAKARKQRRVKKRMTKARKKAEAVTNNIDMTAREKASELRKIYKKATTVKPKDKQYIVMKKTFGGRRPKGVKGPSKMVDRRLKKDKMAAERTFQKRNPKAQKNRKPQKGRKARK